MRRKNSLLDDKIFDKNEAYKNGRGQRRESGVKMSDSKINIQRKPTGPQPPTKRSQMDVAECQRLDRVLKKEMRNFEKVLAKEHQSLK